MKHYFVDVPKLGNVAVSRRAQARCEELHISEEEFREALMNPHRDVPDGQDVVVRQRNHLHLVVLRHPDPPSGACLVKTVYRMQPKLLAGRRVARK